MPHDPDCIFCKIVAGTIPSFRLHEDDTVIALLDVFPLSRGHALVVPREHHATLDQLPDTTAAHIGSLLPGLSRRILAATGATAFNILQNNGRLAHQAIDHVHVHIIPRYDDAGLGIEWQAGKLTPDEGKALCSAIRG